MSRSTSDILTAGIWSKTELIVYVYMIHCGMQLSKNVMKS